jgi:pullulanase
LVDEEVAVIADLLQRKRTHFVLWTPQAPGQAPSLVIGEFQPTNPATLVNERTIPLTPAAQTVGLWELAATTAGLQAGTVYHYWFEVDDTKAGRPAGQRIRVTDPTAFTVDWRVRAPVLPAPNTDNDRQVAAVIRFDGTHLIPCDPAGETADLSGDVPHEGLPPNNQIVIYELPTAWTRVASGGELERGVGTFQDALALVEPSAGGGNFTDLAVLSVGRSYLGELGVNTIELLPPEDSAVAREWGYATTNFFAPDFDLGLPEQNSSPTANRDLAAFIRACHQRGIRVFSDIVMAFWRHGPYEHIDSADFHIFDPGSHRDDPDALTSTRGFGLTEVRNGFGSSLIRYARVVQTYDPVSGANASVSPARQLMLTHLERWMRDYHIDGVRLDTVENVYNWDFLGSFRNRGRALWEERWNAQGLPGDPDSRFLVIGEELSLPMDLLRQHRLDALWNDRFREFIRAALVGQTANNHESFESTVRKGIDCRHFGFTDGAQAVNYLTSHDVEGFRKERLWNFLGANGVVDLEQRKKRIKLGFVCLMTAVGIPMILAGEEFGDEHDRFDSQGHVTQGGGKQTDPVNFSRAEDPSRSGLAQYVSRLVKLRTSHPAPSVNDIEFIHADFTPGRRVLAWRRGSLSNPVVVVANFSGFGSAHTPQGVAEYRIPKWPATPPGRGWREVTQERHVPPEWVGRESLFPWEAKVYVLA